MITFEEAYKIAKEIKPDIDGCTEYEKGYVFGCQDDDRYEGAPGRSPVVILKENGKDIPMIVFVHMDPSDEIRDIPLPKD